MMKARLAKELKMLAVEPPPGVCGWPVDDDLTHLQAQLQGPDDTPYEGGIFLLDLVVPERYPFEPPKVRFLTPIYHPNIDTGGRICLDTLKMQPAGSWTPSINIPTLLTTIRVLVAQPNGDDGLMPDITSLFLSNREHFDIAARKHTAKHATADQRQALALAPSKSFGALSSSPGEAGNKGTEAAKGEPSRAAASDSNSDSDSGSDSSDDDQGRSAKKQRKS
ncbi:unnamed protein product [Chrysoparadoxa australica]